MGAAEAFQSGGWPLVAILLAAGVIAYLARKVERLEKIKEDGERERKEIDRETRQLIGKREERDQERLRRYEEQEQRNQQTEARR